MNDEFRAYAEGRGLTLSEAMRHAIQLYIDDPEPTTLTPDERKEVRRLAREQYAHLVAENMPSLPPMPAIDADEVLEVRRLAREQYAHRLAENMPSIDPDAVMGLVKQILAERIEMAFRPSPISSPGDSSTGGTDMDLQRAS